MVGGENEIVGAASRSLRRSRPKDGYLTWDRTAPATSSR